MTRYRTLARDVEVVRWTGVNHEEVEEFLRRHAADGVDPDVFFTDGGAVVWQIGGDGTLHAAEGDWIVVYGDDFGIVLDDDAFYRWYGPVNREVRG